MYKKGRAMTALVLVIALCFSLAVPVFSAEAEAEPVTGHSAQAQSAQTIDLSIPEEEMPAEPWQDAMVDDEVQVFDAPDAAPDAAPDELVYPQSTATDLQALIDAAGDSTEEDPLVLNITGDVALSEKLKIGNARHVLVTGGGRVLRTEGYFAELFSLHHGGSLVLENITLDGRKSSDLTLSHAALVTMYYGTLRLKAGAVLKNNAGVGIQVDYGTPQMEGGLITGNNSHGVHLTRYGYCSLKMSGGEISGNGLVGNASEVYGVLGSSTVYSRTELSGTAVIGNDGAEKGINIPAACILVGVLQPGARLVFERKSTLKKGSSLAKSLEGSLSDETVARCQYSGEGLKPARNPSSPEWLILASSYGTELQDRVDAAVGGTRENPVEIELTGDMLLGDRLIICNSADQSPRHIRLTGHALKRGHHMVDYLVAVYPGSSLVLEDITLDGHNPTEGSNTLRGLVGVAEEAALTIKAGTVLENNVTNTTVFTASVLAVDGECVVEDVLIRNNSAVGTDYGTVLTSYLGTTKILDGVLASGGGTSFYNYGQSEISGGTTLSGSETRYSVVNGDVGTLALKGGATVQGNNGGGVLNYGELTLADDVSIADNNAQNGAGIYNVGNVSMAGGSITGNTALATGGGVLNMGEFNVSSGVIEGNTAGATGGEVQLSYADAVLTLSGPVIIGRADGAAGIYQSLPVQHRLAISAALEDDALLVLETPAFETEGYVVAAGARGYAPTSRDAARFMAVNGDILRLDKINSSIIRGSIESLPMDIELDKPYLVLEQGKSAQLTATLTDVRGTVKYRVRSSTPAGLVAVDEDTGVLTASAATGSAVVRAYCAQQPNIYAECRVDVVAAPGADEVPAAYHFQQTAVTANTKATVAATLTLWQEAAGAGTYRGGLDAMQLEFAPSGGAKTQAAADMLNNAFELIALDGRSVRLVPKDGIDDLRLGSKYTAKVKQRGTDTLLAPEALTVKINKKLPTLSAEPIQFNFFYNTTGQNVVLKNERVTALELNPAQKRNNDKLLTGSAAWLQFSNGTVTLTKEQKRSGTLQLLAQVDSWREPVPVKVSLKAVSAPPAFKFSVPTLRLDSDQTNDATLKLLPKNDNQSYDALGVSSITVVAPENLTKSQAKTYKLQKFFAYPSSGNASDGTIWVGNDFGELSKMPGSGGKLLIEVKVRGSDKPVFLSLNLSFKKTSVKLKASKGTVTLNPGLTEPEWDDVVVSTGVDGRELDGRDLHYQVCKKIGGRYYEYDWGDMPLDVSLRGTTASIGTNGLTKPGQTYYVRIVDGDPSWEEYYEEVFPHVFIKVNTRKADAPPSAGLKVKGSLNLTTGAGAIVTTNFKNMVGTYQEEKPFTIKDDGGTAVTGQFIIDRLSGTQWRVTPDPQYDILPGAYTISASGHVGNQPNAFDTKAVNLKVGASAPKVTQSTKTVTLYPKDPGHEAFIRLAVPAQCARLAKVSIKPTTASANYEIEDAGNGWYVICFKDRSAVSAENAVGTSLTLEVKLKGNASETPVKTIKVKVALK